MNFVAALVIMFAFFQVGGIQTATLTVAQVLKGTPAATAGLRVGDRLIAVNGTALKSWDAATNFLRTRPHQRIMLTYRDALGRAAHGRRDALDQTGRAG